MEVSTDVVVYAAGAVLALGIWLLRLEGKVKFQEASRKEILTELRYIRGRVDAIYSSRPVDPPG